MTNPWINKYQNWNTFYSPNISHSLKIQDIFCCMRCDTRTRVFNFWNLRCRKRSKKGLYQLWLLRALKILFERISRNKCGFIYLLPKIDYWAKFEGKLFSDAKYLGLLLQRSPLKTETSQSTISQIRFTAFWANWWPVSGIRVYRG